MTDAELTALYTDFAARWKPTPEELAVQGAYGANDLIHDRRLAVIEDMAALTPLEAAYVAVKMALDERAYSRLGQYLRVAMFGAAVAGPVDRTAATRVLDIRPVE